MNPTRVGINEVAISSSRRLQKGSSSRLCVLPGKPSLTNELYHVRKEVIVSGSLSRPLNTDWILEPKSCRAVARKAVPLP